MLFKAKYKVSFVLIFLLSGELLFGQSLKLIIPKGHTNPVTQIVSSLDKKYVASTDGTNEITIWDYNTAKEVSRYALDNSVSTMLINGSDLLIGQKDGVLAKVNLKTLLISELGKIAESEIISINSSNSQIFLATAGGQVILLNNQYEKSDSVDLSLNLSSCLVRDHFIYAGTNSGSLLIYDQKGETTLATIALGESKINDIAISPSGKFLVVSDTRGYIYQIDLISNLLKETYHTFTLRARDMIFLDENRLLAVGRDEESNLKEINFLEETIKPSGLWQDEVSYKSFPFGLYALEKLDGNNIFVSGYDNNFWRLDSLNNGTNYIGEAGRIHDIEVDGSGKMLAIGADHSEISIIDLTGRTNPRVIESGDKPTSLKWLGTELFAGLSNGKILKVERNKSSIINPQVKSSYSNTRLDIDSAQEFSLRKYSADGIPVIRLEDLTVAKNLKKAGFSYAFHPQKRELIYLNTKRKIEIWSTGKFKKVRTVSIEDILKFNLTGDSKTIVAQQKDNLLLVDYESGNIINTWPINDVGGERVFVSPALDQIYIAKASRTKGSTTTNYHVAVIDAKNGKEVFQLSNHNAFVTDIEFIKNGNYILTASSDGSIKLWKNDGTHLGDIIPLTKGEHVVIAANGLFDATTNAMDKLSYLQGTEVIQLSQVKSKYYEPNLLSKLLGFNTEPIRHADPLTHVKLYPEFELVHPIYNEGKLGIKIVSREGGTGRIIILINGKEVNSDIQPADDGSAEFDILNHPYILTGDLNRISVKVQNEAGDAESSPRNLYYLDKRKPEDLKPHLYGLVIGVSEYQGDKLDLKYAAKDANDISSAIELSAIEYLGNEQVHIKRLTTTQDSTSVLWPSKANIKQALKEIADKATARDILFLYMSGHGDVDKVNTNDFYYLTADAGNGNLEDIEYRKNALLSNVELVDLIKEIAALKQVLVVDACHSGSLVSTLSGDPSSTMSSTQVRSLEKIKDHAGMYVLAGSAADAVSYESTIFGQGLLTYSLLMGMKGPALRDNKFVDILNLFSYASNEVPELASEIGGIQKPEIKIPSTGSFDIGLLDNESKKKIEVNSPKPIFIHSSFQHETRYYDILDLGHGVDDELRHMDDLTDSEIVFLNTNNYPDAFSIRGRYTMVNNKLEISVKLFKGLGQVGDFQFSTEDIKNAPELVVREVIERIKPVINSEH